MASTDQASLLILRARSSEYTAIPMEEALSIVSKEVVDRTDVKEVTLDVIQLDSVSASPVIAQHSCPSVRLSAKDGYAVLSKDGAGIRKVVANTTAGSGIATFKLQEGQCCRVSTGSMVPDGADAVVMVEHTKLLQHDNVEELEIEISMHPIPEQDIRQIGSDFKKGDILVNENTRIGPAEIAMIRQSGQLDIEVFRRPRVCVLSTGNELVEASSQNIADGMIRDSNRPQLLSLFKSYNFHGIDAGIAIDNRNKLVEAIEEAFRFSNVLVTSGGVSMGEKDLLKSVLTEDFNFKIHFGRVFMKPGLPTTFATGKYKTEGKRYVFALPGNPVSSFVTAHLFVVPALLKMAGQKVLEPLQGHPKMNVKLLDDIKLDARPEYRRAWLDLDLSDNMPRAKLTFGNNASSAQINTVTANILLELPASSVDRRVMKRGEIVQALIISKIWLN
uniref:MoCF_biosynth domain-containing protein n=1 Tax=Rhabditophanes sp. KR3021 TaxID=114890 RepID=A0AC35TMF2_9BILA